jgi:hypothetical protein
MESKVVVPAEGQKSPWFRANSLFRITQSFLTSKVMASALMFPLLC